MPNVISQKKNDQVTFSLKISQQVVAISMEGVFPRIPSSVRHLLLQLAILGLALAASTHHPLQPPPGAKLPSDASIRAAKAFLDQHPVFDG